MLMDAFFAKRQTLSTKPGMPARRLAATVLAAVLREKKPFDDAFARIAAEPPYNQLESRDTAFARLMSATALRRAGQIRAVLLQFIDKPPPPPQGDFNEIMLIAAAQLLFLKSPPHAVIDLTVEQLKEDSHARRFAKLANAVLRRVSERATALAAEDEEANAPAWLYQRWVSAYGEEAARRIAAQHLVEPPLDLTVKSDPALWAAKLCGIALPTGTVRLLHKGRVEDIEGYQDGAWWVQDAAAALPAKLLGPLDGLTVADLCAAPGGKTAQLVLAGAKVTSVDQSRHRIKRLRENLERLKLEAEIVEADVNTWNPDSRFDAILLDAPCSSTGTIRRNPDIPWLKKPEDIASLAKVQTRLLDHAVTLLKPGGRLVFCTCSLQPEEGPAQIAALIARNPSLSVSPIEPEEIGGYGEYLSEEGFLRTLPCYLQLSDPDLSGMDGFFACRLTLST